VRPVGWARGARVPAPRVRQARGELGRLDGAELGGRHAEVAAARGLHAVDAGPELDDVQVELEDPALAEGSLELPGEDGLTGFPQRAPRGGQPEVLRELLSDRRGSARRLPALDRAVERLAHLARVEPAVVKEGDVLGRDDRALDVGRDGRVGHPRPLDSIVAPRRALFGAVALDEGGGPRRAGGERRDPGPGPRLGGEPDDEPEEREGGEPPREGAEPRSASARHGVQSSPGAGPAGGWASLPALRLVGVGPGTSDPQTAGSSGTTRRSRPRGASATGDHHSRPRDTGGGPRYGRGRAPDPLSRLPESRAPGHAQVPVVRAEREPGRGR
jgi:hypothetical protein